MACAIEVCAPALDLREVPKRRTTVHKLACASSDRTRIPTHAAGEEISPVAVAALEEISNVAMSASSESRKHFEPMKETQVSARSMQSVSLTSLEKVVSLRSSMKGNWTKQIAFDDSFPHPERVTLHSERPQNPCMYLTDETEIIEWELQSTISHKVAVLKGNLMEMMVNGTLVSRCCASSHDGIQFQGSIQNEEMEFYFVDSRDSWTYNSPDDIGEEVSWGRVSTVAAVTSAATIMTDESVADLPEGLWLMDTGCGHDLINDEMADGLPVKTLKKQSRLVFSTANGRIESRSVVPLLCKELNQLVHPYLLRETPLVLSVGKLCMEKGVYLSLGRWQIANHDKS